ncbi:MAG: cupin domain-containing protein [Lachnospiraceae bacterium]|nr:cupin domain-containing protein [Lachnospiraceae bacterium]
MYYVLLSGGSGNRLWPLSGETRPKQYLKLVNKENNSRDACSMLQRVWEQLEEAGMAKNTIITACREQKEMIYSQIRPTGIVEEPEARDTFPAVLLSCAFLYSEMDAGREEYVAFLPVDPYTEQKYFKSIQRLEEVTKHTEAEVGLLGVVPKYPASKYGYILPGEEKETYLEVKGFLEKNQEEAAEMLLNKRALWNCGVFCVKIGDMLRKLKEYQLKPCYGDVYTHYHKLPKISFDYEVLQKSNKLVAVKFDGFWKDLGTWDAMAEQMNTDTKGNVVMDHTCMDTQVVNELEIPVTVMGAKNMVVVASRDGILVADKNEAAKVKEITKKIDYKSKYEERRWGTLETLHESGNNGVFTLTRKIKIYEGMNSSYHYHTERDEIWTILSGKGELILEGNKIALEAGKAICIRKNQKHAIKAFSDFEYIEMHVGKSVGNDDINRITFRWDGVELANIL